MESRARTLTKTLSWRFFATIITFSLGWMLTGEIEFGLILGLSDTLIKLVAYYFHERAWTRVHTGYRVPQPPGRNGEGI